MVSHRCKLIQLCLCFNDDSDWLELRLLGDDFHIGVFFWGCGLGMFVYGEINRLGYWLISL